MVFYKAALGDGHGTAACCEEAVSVKEKITSFCSLMGGTLVESAGVGMIMVYGCTDSALFGVSDFSSSD